jgi:hypothetical protein
VIVATRLRKGSVNSARAAARPVADAIETRHVCGLIGLVVLRVDSTSYGQDVIAARRHKIWFSVTARTDRAVTRPPSKISNVGGTAARCVWAWCCNGILGG